LVIGVNEAVFDRLRGQLEDTKVKLQKEELERERATKLAAEARLTALEARIHPHFLFNALNSISSLIPVDPKRAERLVERVAALLRFSFDAHRNGLVRFEQEMKIVRDYLEIEQARLGRRLKYNVESGDELHEFRVPPFSVQTLVENSIKYAIAPSLDGGEIFVHAGCAEGNLRVDVSDTGSGFEIDSVPEGHGLDNLRSRLAALFGGAAELSVHRAGDRTVVSLKVPA
jgi:LytS/YehU family sensor histidine kinase